MGGAISQIVPDVLTVILAAILMALFVAVFSGRAGSGRARVGVRRTMDLAAQAWVPYFAVEVLAAAVNTIAQRAPSNLEHQIVQLLGVAWAALVWALGLRAALSISPPADVPPTHRARAAGGLLMAALAVMLAANVVLSVRNLETLSRVGTPPGQRVPDFDLPLLDAGRVRLAEGRGHVTVLSFWATWCGPCKAELPELDALSRRLGPGVRFVAINTEGPEALGDVRTFIREHRLALPVAIDDGRVAGSYGVEVIPHLVVVDANLVARTVFVGSRSSADIARAIDDARGGP